MKEQCLETAKKEMLAFFENGVDVNENSFFQEKILDE